MVQVTSIYKILVNCCYACFTLFAMQTTGKQVSDLLLSDKKPALFVLDGYPIESESSALSCVLANNNICTIILASHGSPKVLEGIRSKFGRDCNIVDIKPLSSNQSTQRVVHSILSEHPFVPTDDDKQVLKRLGEFTCGSPTITDIMSQVVRSRFSSHGADNRNGILCELAKDISLNVDKHSETDHNRHLRPVSEHLSRTIPLASPDCQDVWETSSKYDAWGSVNKLIDACNLSQQQRLLLHCLTTCHHSPVPFSLASELSTIIASSLTYGQESGEVLLSQLQQFKLVKDYPQPVVSPPPFCRHQANVQERFLYVPRCSVDGLWKCMETEDQLTALCTTRHALSKLQTADGIFAGLQLQVNEVSAKLEVQVTQE